MTGMTARWSLKQRVACGTQPTQVCYRVAASAHRRHARTFPTPVPHCSSFEACSTSNAWSESPGARQRAATSSRKPFPREAARWDVLGLGQGMIDYTTQVPDALLESFAVAKGARRVITVEERGDVIRALDDAECPSQISAGGSLANTLVAISRLAKATGQHLSVAMGGSMGKDALAQYFSSQLQDAGVRVLSDDADAEPSTSGAHTGTVMVLITPDAQRSFLSFFCNKAAVLSPDVRAAICSSRLVVIEGYLWELSDAACYIHNVITLARAAGCQVALTAGDARIVKQHREAILQAMQLGVDIMFASAEEARELVPPVDNALQAATWLGARVPIAIVTDGSRGSVFSAFGTLQHIPPSMPHHGVVDTCGAGDAYAAGVLFALACGYSVEAAGRLGSSAAAAVIGQHSPHLEEEDARQLAQLLPAPACEAPQLAAQQLL